MQESMEMESRYKAPVEMLVKAIGIGNRAMEAEFYRRYHSSTLRYLSSYTHDAARAEDIAHDALIKVLIRLRESSVEHPACLGRFVQQTAKYSMLDWRHRKGNQVEYRESLDDTLAENVDQYRFIALQEKKNIVAQTVARMKIARDREVLLRYYFYDESKESICKAIKLGSAHFDRVLSRARKRLAALFIKSGEVLSEIMESE